MTKTLYLVRHAKSDWSTGEADFERPLNKRGRRDAPDMGQRLKENGALPEIICCSPARRASQTLELLDLGINACFDGNIYEATVGDLLGIVQNLPDNAQSAMLIGHNPAMTWLAATAITIMMTKIRTKRWLKGVCPILTFPQPPLCPGPSPAMATSLRLY